jgi:hypothetical protein
MNKGGAMNQPEQPRGNFVINLNFKRNTNPKAPPITGRISTPEDPETEFNFSAFEHTDKNGESYWIGPVDMNRSVRQALNTTQAQPNTHFVAIRENGFKVFKELPSGAPNPAYAKLSKAEQEHEDSKPSYWASWTRTEAEPQLRASAWERDASRYGPWASGNTQHPLTKEQVAALGTDKAHADMLNAPEPAHTPRKKVAAGRGDPSRM